MKLEFYAIVSVKKPTVFLARAQSLLQIEKQKEQSYWLAKSMSAKGSQFKMSDYMKDKTIVHVTINEVNHE
jgi:hypothetical protein